MRVIVTCPEGGRRLARPFQLLLNAAAEMVAVAMAQNPLPPLRSANVEYHDEPTSGNGDEYFDHPWDVIARGWGDCDDLVIWRVAECLVRGLPAHARIVRIGTRYHTQVTREWDGLIEDPCLMVLGSPWLSVDNGKTYIFPPPDFLY